MTSTSLDVMRQHLEMFQQTFSNALTDSSPKAKQSQYIQTPLYPHQLAAVHAMQSKEIQLQQGYVIPNTGQILISNHAIFSDSFGTGKTLSVLGHIANMKHYVYPNSFLHLHPSSTPSFFSLNTATISPTFQTLNSLLVVPFAIYHQWQETISSQTTLTAVFLKTQRDLDRETLVESIQQADIVLISNTLLSFFLNSLRAREISVTWRRVIYDEADTIKIPSSCPQPHAKMTWFVTSSFSNLFLYNQCYHSNIVRQLPQDFLQSLDVELFEQIQYQIENHPNIRFFRIESTQFFRSLLSYHPLRGHLVVRSSREFLQHSISLPPLHRHIVRCQAPLRNCLIENAVSEEIQELLHAGDVNGALNKLGVSSHTPLTLIDAVLKRFEEQLSHFESINASISNRESVQQELSTLRKRLAEVPNDACAICFEEPTMLCVTPCCFRSFCASCILEWMSRIPNCPLCRKVFHANSLIRIGDSCQILTPEKKPSLPKKMEALLKIFRENPQGKFILCSMFDSTFDTLQNTLEHSFPMATLQGNKDVIANMLEDFDAGILRLLMIPRKQAAAGLHIPSATHIIFMHKMGFEEERQIICRAYRLGRKEPLHCISLLHERE